MDNSLSEQQQADLRKFKELFSLKALSLMSLLGMIKNVYEASGIRAHIRGGIGNDPLTLRIIDASGEQSFSIENPSYEDYLSFTTLYEGLKDLIELKRREEFKQKSVERAKAFLTAEECRVLGIV